MSLFHATYIFHFPLQRALFQPANWTAPSLRKVGCVPRTRSVPHRAATLALVSANTEAT